MIRLIAYILLFIHINTTMFIPVADEKDVYDACGRQINDINTFFELINEVMLGNTDVAGQDEDDDLAHYFTGAGITSYVPNAQQIILSREEPSTTDLAIAYPRALVQKISTIAYDILTPPPKA
ncbi:hypothetical protein L3C95_31835 [Chitinophaga filiformis]|uniref:hypothetical protein n=1 Tax=Chitinophaga filiformis TaxID=104663 RepID=UPI001F413C68|nr:hypothetical protein [Chitinophaga filiformis]MCF6407526.1 hypothetical protein [Chitinophaga filiformis]